MRPGPAAQNMQKYMAPAPLISCAPRPGGPKSTQKKQNYLFLRRLAGCWLAGGGRRIKAASPQIKIRNFRHRLIQSMRNDLTKTMGMTIWPETYQKVLFYRKSDSDESDSDESAWIRINIFVSWTQNTLLLGLRAGVIFSGLL